MSSSIASSMFQITWINESKGFLECPGKHFHTGKNSKRDCQIIVSGAPTIFCFHSSCSSLVEEANYKLRKAIWDNQALPKRKLNESERIQIRLDIKKKKENQKLIKWACDNKEKIFEKYSWPIADVFHESPVMSNSPEEDGKLFLRLYNLNDTLWIGEPTDSGREEKKDHFKPVSEWISQDIDFHFTCPSTFKAGSFSRSNENVLSRPFLVIESDTLTQDETCSLFKWMKGFLVLRAIIFTGGKSMHGWFEFPRLDLFEKLKVCLPELGCDEALFKPSQPVRMPGIKRNDQWQCLYWFNNL